MTPAVGTVIFVKYRNGVCGLSMLNQLADSILAGNKTRRALYCVNTADQVQGINNQQMYCHVNLHNKGDSRRP
jgi:hypothetical protein